MARERCKALLTDAIDVPNVSAVSSAENCSTSRSSSTARWLGGNDCSAVVQASVMFSRASSFSSGVGWALCHIIDSGSGSSHGSSRWLSAALGSPAGAPSPRGRTRREAAPRWLRHVLVAMRYIHVRVEARPSKSWKERHARRYVSCTASSASAAEPIIV